MQHRSAIPRLAFAVFAAIVLAAAIMNQARATVIWRFFETGISCFLPSTCSLPPQPFVLATLTLPGPISSGTAEWRGTGTQPVYTGDEFSFDIGFLVRPLSPAFNGDQGGTSCQMGGGRPTICDFDISWSSSADALAIGIDVNAVFDNISLGSVGGRIATDASLGGCENSQCQIAGFWQNDLAVPEPSSASLILAGLFGSWLTRRRLASQAV